jgi:hypothetical protein
LATICADFNGFTRGGGRIVANRGSYSATANERKRSEAVAARDIKCR